MKRNKITSIRILPSDKVTFPTEADFQNFVEHTMPQRGGYYYFPNQMMNCPENTLVLFQYNGMIRAVGLLIDLAKEPKIDERGVQYAGYYRFDIDTLDYLDRPIDRIMMKSIYPSFTNFNQSKQRIPYEYLDDILDLLEKSNSITVEKR